MENNLIYLRFGKIPENGRSGIYNGDEGKVGEENGVSCYRGIIIDDEVFVIIPHKQSTTYYWLIDQYNNNEIPLYVVSGVENGIGSDNEPLLTDVLIIKEIINWKYGK